MDNRKMVPNMKIESTICYNFDKRYYYKNHFDDFYDDF